VMEKHEFLKEVRRQKLDERDFQDKLLYLKILNYPPQRRTLRLYLNCDLAQLNNELHKLLVSSGFEVLEPQATWLGEVNHSLARRKLVCILSDRTAQELKQRLRLGPLFQIHQVEDSMGSKYYIAFGQEALLLESELHFWKTVGDHAMML